ncbi:MAG: PilN domain-containing protein [Terriglobia bacterium]
MKVRVNLAQPEKWRERTVYLWAPVLVLVGVVLLVHLISVSARQFVEYQKVHRSVLRYEAEVHETQAKEIRLKAVLHQPGTLKLYGQINFLNSLIEQKKVSLSGLTIEVARLLPGQVRITGLSLADTAKGPVIQISVEGAVNQVTGVFLSNLEASPDFEGVTVLDQSFGTENQPGNLVSLTCSARYIGKTLPGLEAAKAEP